MTDLREAAQQALEFLRILDYVPKRSPRFNKAITALEIALATSSDMEDVNAAFDAEYKKYKAEPKPEPYRPHENMIQLAATLVNATAELNRIVFEESSLLKTRKVKSSNIAPESSPYGQAQKMDAPQPEPVAFYDFGNHRMRWAKPTTYDQLVSVDVPELPLYTHPPKRQHSEIEQLKAERDALLADAERYQLLKSRVEEYDGHACFPDIPLPCPIPDVSPFDRIDAAIDAARGDK